jgi:hypothetical protein
MSDNNKNVENGDKDEVQHKILQITEEQFFEPIKDEYVRNLSKMGMADFDDGYNPGLFLLFFSIYILCKDQQTLMDP